MRRPDKEHRVAFVDGILVWCPGNQKYVFERKISMWARMRIHSDGE